MKCLWCHGQMSCWCWTLQSLISAWPHGDYFVFVSRTDWRKLNCFKDPRIPTRGPGIAKRTNSLKLLFTATSKWWSCCLKVLTRMLQNSNGRTPLHKAGSQGNGELVHLLLKKVLARTLQTRRAQQLCIWQLRMATRQWCSCCLADANVKDANGKMPGAGSWESHHGFRGSVATDNYSHTNAPARMLVPGVCFRECSLDGEVTHLQTRPACEWKM